MPAAAAKKKPTEAPVVPFDPLPPEKSPPLADLIDKRVPLKELHEDELNPRQHFDEAKLKELSATIDVQGLMDPLTVRPRAKGGYSITDGARRYRALQMLPKEKRESLLVPVRVRELTDSQYLEQALVKAGQREGLTALEEGATFARLRDQYHYSIEKIQEKTGKSRTVVFQRMKLASLKGEARKMLEKGEMSASVAEYVARMPSPELQEKALTLLTNGLEYGEELVDLPVRRAKEILDAEFNLVLAKAPFDVKNASLLTGCGACGSCPKRTGAEPDLFAETGKDDRCLDSDCWKAKTNAGLAELRANGARVVTVKHSHQLYDLEKHGLARPEEKPDGKKTWDELLGANVPKAIISAASGERREVVDVKAALKLLAEKKPEVAKKLEAEAKKKETSDEKWKAEQAREAEKRVIAALADKVVCAALVNSPKLPLETAAQLAALALSKSYHLEKTLKDFGVDVRKLQTLKGPTLAHVLCIIATHAQRDSYGGQVYPDVTAAIAKAVKLDTKKLGAQLAKGKPGTCIACGAKGEKTKWANKAQTLCTTCTGGET